MKWYDFISKGFSGDWRYLKVRDRVVVVCSQCKYHGIMTVKNLKSQVKRKGKHLCWSCSAKEGQQKGLKKYKNTMKKLYGVEYPLQNQELKEKAQKTAISRLGMSAIKYARKSLTSKKKNININKGSENNNK